VTLNVTAQSRSTLTSMVGGNVTLIRAGGFDVTFSAAPEGFRESRRPARPLSRPSAQPLDPV
jgi:hypothetical protein